MFWLMELDLLSLKGSAVSSSRFWSVFGFSMLLGSRSGFCGVRCVYFRSSFKVTLSVTAVQPVPYLSLGSLLVHLFPCPTLRCWQKLAR